MTSFHVSVCLAAILLAGTVRADDLPAPSAASDTSGDYEGVAPSGSDTLSEDGDTVPDAPDVPNTTGPIAPRGPVSVTDINVVDGEPVGLIDDAGGGLGTDMWAASPRDQLEQLLEATPIRSNDSTIRSLARRILLTASQSPIGSGKRALITVRIAKLLDGSMVSDGGALAAKAHLTGDVDFAQVRTQAILLSGDVANACTDATAERLTNGEVFWLELRAYCFAAAGDQGQVELIDQLLEAQGGTDAAYKMLRDDAVQHLNYMPGVIAKPTALHVFLMKAAGLPMTPELVDRFHLAERPIPVVDNAGVPITADDIYQAASAYGSLHDVDPAKQRHGALIIGLADALDIAMTPNVQGAVAQINAQTWPGGKPSATDFARIDEAVAQPDRRGEAVLRIIEAIEARDLAAMAPDATVHLVQALRRIGLDVEARAIAAKALREYRDVPLPAPPSPVAPP